ncbi:normal mucosa of esophagus-specific gene 1 protein-like isoform X2 [Tachypleus tridentatus]|uniref:normal mucosa of esophagus-specific gene 1 protein-like isoform X2 n=1 Tax=Tachypleus tridentatus TaxID=6853 RepID=UPI003FD09A80
MSSSVNKPQGIRHHEMKSFGFGLRAFKKFPEILPLVTILGTACLGTVAFAFYSLYQKSDVIVNKRKEFPPWERVNPETPQKFLIHGLVNT